MHLYKCSNAGHSRGEFIQAVSCTWLCVLEACLDWLRVWLGGARGRKEMGRGKGGFGSAVYHCICLPVQPMPSGTHSPASTDRLHIDVKFGGCSWEVVTQGLKVSNRQVFAHQRRAAYPDILPEVLLDQASVCIAWCSIYIVRAAHPAPFFLPFCPCACEEVVLYRGHSGEGGVRFVFFAVVLSCDGGGDKPEAQNCMGLRGPQRSKSARQAVSYAWRSGAESEQLRGQSGGTGLVSNAVIHRTTSKLPCVWAQNHKAQDRACVQPLLW